MLQSNESGEEFKFKLEVKNEESKRSNELNIRYNWQSQQYLIRKQKIKQEQE